MTPEPDPAALAALDERARLERERPALARAYSLAHPAECPPEAFGARPSTPHGHPATPHFPPPTYAPFPIPRDDDPPDGRDPEPAPRLAIRDGPPPLGDA